MKRVDKQRFEELVEFIQEANNYAGGGSPRHDLTGSEFYYLMRGGKKELVAQCGYDQFVGMIYEVSEDVVKRYKELRGYSI